MSEINFPVVGIGASAGGLKALQEFFDHIPENSGLAFVVIVHLAPQKTSAMETLLASHTSMQVTQLKKATKIKPDNIYIIPPDKQLQVTDGMLQLFKAEDHPKAVIDVFFRAMAKDCKKQSISIILSGTGSDGTLGLKAIKEHGGVIMVQDPEEAEFEGMPFSAIETGIVDFVMPVKQLAKKVMDYKDFLGKIKIPLESKELSEKETTALKEIFGLLASKKGYDFNNYKRSSVLRRMQRRMHVNGSPTIEDYREFISDNPTEINELFKDLLISVTNFFRDPKAFEALRKQVIPELFKGKQADDQIRVWVIGCATGEELYSLAILLHEYATENLDQIPQIKIFGTDISDEALKIARKGIYSESIAADVSEKRLNSYFHNEDSGYRIRRGIREMVLISKHNAISDPPFANIDLISCRNLLIYFNHDLQKQVLRVFQYALKPESYLFLGLSESTIGAMELYEPLNNTEGVYKTKPVSTNQKELPRFLLWQNMRREKYINENLERSEAAFEEVHKSLLTDQYAPASIIIDEHNKVMHFSKGVNKFLEYAEGEPTSDLLKLVNPEIKRPLRSVIYRLNQMEEPQLTTQRIKTKIEDQQVTISLRIQPINVAGFPKGYRQVIFEEIEEKSTSVDQTTTTQSVEEPKIVEQLENELEQAKEQLQQTVEEYETSNEELMASNEELQSMNEELQTATEELETSQEELQSVNEELRMVNQELEHKINELEDVNDDLKNLMEATEIVIIFVDKNMKIMRFTSNAEGLFNFIKSDVGRPLSDVRHELKYDHLAKDVEQVFDDLEPIEKQISSNDSNWYMMRIKPYRTTKNVAAGAVLTFVDITNLKKIEDELEEKVENQKQLQRELLDIEKKERWRIGQYLHDKTAQNLVAAKTLLDSRASLVKKVEEPLREVIEDIKQLIIEALHNIRELSHFVLPIKDNMEGVAHAFEQLANQTKNLYDIECTFKSDDVVEKFKDITSASSVYYIAQEAIRNAINHGEADNISIELSSENDTLHLTVKDNGSGYDEKSKGEGMGIHIMKYRAELLEGSLKIDSTKDKGTVLRCGVPLKNILQAD